MPIAYEFQGKNVERALQKASDQLNIPAEKIKHEVVAYGSTGIFGLVGVKKAKIKVFVERDPAIQKHAHQPDNNRGTASGALAVDAAADRPQAKAPEDDHLVQYGQQALQRIATGISSEAVVDWTREKEKIQYSISGGESGVLIGKRGQTLEAMQYLLEKMINKKSGSRVRVVVDIEGYLEKRKSNLQQMAEKMADKAKRTKKPVTVGQMNAHDRRIIHIHLKDDKTIRTQSLGEGYYRKLMIFPKKQSRPKRRGSADPA